MTTSDKVPGPDGGDRLDWGRYEAELGDPAHPDSEPVAGDDRQVLVDSPAAQRPPRPGLSGWRAAQRRPILPGWARSGADRRELCRWAVGFVAHTSAYHLARTPPTPASWPHARPAVPPACWAGGCGGCWTWKASRSAKPACAPRTPRPTSSWPASATGGSAGAPPCPACCSSLG